MSGLNPVADGDHQLSSIIKQTTKLTLAQQLDRQTQLYCQMRLRLPTLNLQYDNPRPFKPKGSSSSHVSNPSASDDASITQSSADMSRQMTMLGNQKQGLEHQLERKGGHRLQLLMQLLNLSLFPLKNSVSSSDNGSMTQASAKIDKRITMINEQLQNLRSQIDGIQLQWAKLSVQLKRSDSLIQKSFPSNTLTFEREAGIREAFAKRPEDATHIIEWEIHKFLGSYIYIRFVRPHEDVNEKAKSITFSENVLNVFDLKKPLEEQIQTVKPKFRVSQLFSSIWGGDMPG